MPHWQLDRFVVKADANTDYTLTELDGVTVKTLYTGPDAQTPTASNTIHTDANGTAYAYFYGDAQLRRGGALIRDRIRQGWEFLNPADPEFGGASVRAIQLLTPAEVAEVLDPTTFPTLNLDAKIQPWLDAAMGLYGDGLTGNGGRGCRILFDAGNWRFQHLDFRPGAQVIGLSSREEVQFVQDPDYNGDHFLTILGHLSNSDVVQRRTEVLVVDIGAEANGLLDANGDVLNCWHAEPEVFDGSDPDDEVTRTGIIGYRMSGSGASGRGYNSQKRGKNWLHECQFVRNGTPGKDNASGGVFVQGPDSLFNKVYCGSNYGHQLHIKSSETPDVSPVELGVTRSDPTQYASLYLELCTSGHISGGNCTGRIKIEGGEGDTTANEYGVNTWVTIEGVLFSFKNKTFTDHDTDVVKTLTGYVEIKHQKNVQILDCTFHPAYEDDGTDPMTHTVTHRPTNIIHVIGARTTGVFRGSLPPPDDEMWPAGTPEDDPGGPPANPYDTITNKPDQIAVYVIDPSIDTHSHKVDRISGLNGPLEVVGTVQAEGAQVIPKTTMTTVIDVGLMRNDVILTGGSTWTFSDDDPTNGTVCGVTVKASGADRTVTLPAGIADGATGETVATFTVAQNHRHWVVFYYLDANWYVSGYPSADEWLALAGSTSYADDAAAATGGVAIGERYRTGSAVKVRVS